MKKSILIGLLLVGTSCLLFAQPERMPFGEKSNYFINPLKGKIIHQSTLASKEILFYDDFEDNINILSKWEIKRSDTLDFIDTYGATNPQWFHCSFTSFYGNGANYIKSGNHSAAITYTSPDFTWLLTNDTITIPTEKPINLAFWLWYYYSTNYPTRFHVVTYNVDTQITDTIQSWGTDTENSINNQFNQRVLIDLSQFAGSRIRIGFVYDNYNQDPQGNQLAIDDVYLVDQDYLDIEIVAEPFTYSSVPQFLYDSIELDFNATIINNGIEYTDTIKLDIIDWYEGTFKDSLEITDTLNEGEQRKITFNKTLFVKNPGLYGFVYSAHPKNDFNYINDADTIGIALSSAVFSTDNGVIGGFSLGQNQEFGNIYYVAKDAFIGGIQIEWPNFTSSKEFTPFDFRVNIYQLNPIDNSILKNVYSNYLTKTAESSGVYVNYNFNEPIFCLHGFNYLVTVSQLGTEPLGIGYDGFDEGSFWKINQTSGNIERMANPTIGNVTLRLTMVKPESHPLITFTINNNNDEAAANVNIYIPELDSTITTNASGIATIQLDNGTYSYKIDTVGFATINEDFNVFSQNLFFNITLDIPYWVKFNVVNEAQEPIPGAEVIIMDSTLITDSNGLDSLLLSPNNYSYYVMASGYEKNDLGYLEHIAKDTLVTITLSDATTHNLTIEVINEKDELLSNAEVSLFGYGWKYTNTEGKATFTGISDTDIALIVSKYNYWTNSTDIELISDSTVQIILSANRYDVTFFVTSKGNAIPNAEIIVTEIDTAFTSLTGYAVIEFVPFGNDIPFTVKYNGYHTYNGTFNLDNMDARVDVNLTLTAIEPNSIQLINIYPNPNTGEFTINSEGKYAIMIFDITGRLVYSNNLAYGVTPVNINEKPSGIYIVKIVTDQGITTKRIIKQ